MKKLTLLFLVFIVTAAAFLRLVDLGRATMGADVMEFYKICQSDMSPSELMIHSSRYLGDLPPCWFAAHSLFLKVFKVEVSFYSARLPDAIAGILTVLIAFFMGRALGGRSVGLLAAVFTAFQPSHVQMSRECYFYAPIVLGCMLLIWAIIRLADLLEHKHDPDVLFYVLTFIGFFLATNIQISSWAFVFVAVLVMYAMLIPMSVRHIVHWRSVVILTIGLILLGIPTLLDKWGMRDLFNTMFGEKKTYWAEIFGAKKGGWQFVSELCGLLSCYLFGRGWVRSLFGLGSILVGGWALASRWKVDRKKRIFTLFMLGTMALLFFSHSRSIYPEEARHYSSIFPFLVVVVSLGVSCFGGKMADWLKVPDKRNVVILVIGFLLAAGANAYPAWLSTRIMGSPPYNMMSSWSDRYLPPNSVVFCDRWLTPWNELQVNPSTNVFYTFTVPSEPRRVALENRWEETAIQFFKDNPFAAYYGGQQFLTSLFARKQDFIDEAGVKLAAMGLNYRARPADYPRGWDPATIYYNTEADVIAAAKKAHKTTLMAYESTWGYMKPWRMMPGWSEQLHQLVWIQAGAFMERGQTFKSIQDIGLLLQPDAIRYLNQGHWADYRVATEKSQLHLFNLTDTEMNVELALTGVALTGQIRVRVGNNVAQFPPTLLTTRKIPAVLKPGENTFQLFVPTGQILLIRKATIESANGV